MRITESGNFPSDIFKQFNLEGKQAQKCKIALNTVHPLTFQWNVQDFKNMQILKSFYTSSCYYQRLFKNKRNWIKEGIAEKKEKVVLAIPVMQYYFIIEFFKNSIFTMQLCHRVRKFTRNSQAWLARLEQAEWNFISMHLDSILLRKITPSNFFN